MTHQLKQLAARRAKIIRGQADGLLNLIEQDRYCMDILVQSLAMQRALGALNKLLVENHLKSHVAERVKKAGALDRQTINEFMKLYDLDNIRGK
ncbi:MAG: metal-sensitive transcriptional regulator [Candidatus Chaera renei]|uniref:Metal-sensitive transcriptional regulator n=1 Tax=Candidatus Chaera renei TaxID=2506947 RepID=A0A4Q0AKQ5_9BACT|nr:MAG: metal-sensitive transcriptional regulator [Candidatus Chaera renei]